MIFTWDLDKENKNLAKHGLDFSLARLIMSAKEVAVVIDDKHNYGEDRQLIYSLVKGNKYCMCYTLREDTVRVISLRRVHEREWRKHYEDS